MDNEQEDSPTSPVTPGPARRHKATYATDKRAGGYLIRITGPQPEAFAGREVPVVTRGGQEHPERLVRLIWAGNDATTGEKVALYKFESRPRVTQDEIPF